MRVILLILLVLHDLRNDSRSTDYDKYKYGIFCPVYIIFAVPQFYFLSDTNQFSSSTTDKFLAQMAQTSV
jgi:hypothetical protein